MKNPDISSVVTKILMWFMWASFVMGCFTFAHFLPKHDSSVNSFNRQIDLLSISVLILPFALSMALRFMLLPRIRNSWIQFIVYMIGVSISQLIMLSGIFILWQFQSLFFILCAIAMASYIPYWVHAGSSEPTVEGNHAPSVG